MIVFLAIVKYKLFLTRSDYFFGKNILTVFLRLAIYVIRKIPFIIFIFLFNFNYFEGKETSSLFLTKSTEIPTINNPIPHQSESPGSTLRKSVVIPELIRDDAIVVLYFISGN